MKQFEIVAMRVADGESVKVRAFIRASSKPAALERLTALYPGGDFSIISIAPSKLMHGGEFLLVAGT